VELLHVPPPLSGGFSHYANPQSNPYKKIAQHPKREYYIRNSAGILKLPTHRVAICLSTSNL
ncbi:hypothetical protein JTL67_35480, partial [Pseudomonas aeruginosa]|nr:hypothetical protein [Pseudomonas aeruginosa]